MLPVKGWLGNRAFLRLFVVTNVVIVSTVVLSMRMIYRCSSDESVVVCRGMGQEAAIKGEEQVGPIKVQADKV